MSDIRNAGAALKIAVDKRVDSIGRQVASRGTRSVNALRNAELDVLKGERSGRVYKKPYSRATYTASAPGEAPARRSGALRLNWHGSVEGGVASKGGVQIVAALESEQDYSGYLQDGTSHMAARPFKERIIEKATPEIEAIYNEPYS